MFLADLVDTLEEFPLLRSQEYAGYQPSQVRTGKLARTFKDDNTKQ